ncbi:hypothetical protein Egran_04942, partial [Elaphomyces granulatus]
RGWVIEQICRLAECEIATPLDLAELLLGDPTTIHRVAGEADKEEVLEVFNLEEATTCLAFKDSVSQYPVPDQVFKNIEALEAAGYDKTNEAYCRLRAEFIMIPALGQARRNLNVDVKSGSPKKLKTPKKQSRDPESPRRDLKMFHEYDLRTAINHPITGERYIFTGRADWAAGHSGRGLSDSILVCAEAKKRATFSFAEQQLMVYLAICHNERKKAGKVVPSVQGFGTDGQRFIFQGLSSGGTLYSSKIYDTISTEDLKTVYNFIVNQAETAINLSLSTPVKGPQTEREEAVKQYLQDRFWGIFDPPPYCSDGEEEDEPNLNIDAFVLKKSLGIPVHETYGK